MACLVRVSCKNTPERLYATGAGVWVEETQTVAILMLFNNRTVQLGFVGTTTRVLSNLHVQIWPVCDSILSQVKSQYYNIRGPTQKRVSHVFLLFLVCVLVYL